MDIHTSNLINPDIHMSGFCIILVHSQLKLQAAFSSLFTISYVPLNILLFSQCCDPHDLSIWSRLSEIIAHQNCTQRNRHHSRDSSKLPSDTGVPAVFCYCERLLFHQLVVSRPRLRDSKRDSSENTARPASDAGVLAHPRI